MQHSKSHFPQKIRPTQNLHVDVTLWNLASFYKNLLQLSNFQLFEPETIKSIRQYILKKSSSLLKIVILRNIYEKVKISIT